MLLALTSCGQASGRLVGRERSALCREASLTTESTVAKLGPNGRSFWLQPWQAELETFSGEHFHSALALAIPAHTPDFEPRARVAAAAGVRRVLTGWSFGVMDGDRPSEVRPEIKEQIQTRLKSLQAAGVRPLLLLDGNQASVPFQYFDVVLLETAAAGARQVVLDATTAARVVAGRSGISYVSPPDPLRANAVCEVLFTSVDAATGIVTLSKPLPIELARGTYPGGTLLYEPFSKPFNAAGQASSRFGATLSGFLGYVRAVVREAALALGSAEFDLELWNEISSGGMFLDIDHYYDPPIDGGPEDGYESTAQAILERTLDELRDPALGLDSMSLSDGFANTRWQRASSSQPDGVAALSRHVSVSGLRFPDAQKPGSSTPVDARGERAATELPDGSYTDELVPSYDVFFPELPLTAILPLDSRRPGQLMRDLSLTPSIDAAGVVHGRAAGPAREVWLTAVSVNPSSMGELGYELTAEDAWRVQAKSVLRSFVAYSGKGASLVALYAPDDEDFLVFDWSDAHGGEAMRAIARLSRAIPATAPSELRSLSLDSVYGCSSFTQFAGQSERFPALSHENMVAAFVFQTGDQSFAIAAYVMTQNLLRAYSTDLASPQRFDLPPERFELTLSGLRSEAPRATAYDPLTDAQVPVEVRAAKGAVTLELELTDSPRIVMLQE